MTNIHRTSIGVFLLAAAIGLLGLVVFDMLRTDPVSADVIMQRAEKEKQRLLDGIAEGRILYLRSETYQKRDPLLPTNIAWVYPERRTGETWMAADADGNMTIYTGVIRNLDGEALAYSQLENGQRVATWVATGERQAAARYSGQDTLAPWVKGMFSMDSWLSGREFSRVGSGSLDGQQSAVFEMQSTTTSNFTPEQIREMHIPEDQLRGKLVHILKREFIEDKPLILRSSLWEQNDAGGRTLFEEFKIVEYRLLPANTQIGPFN